MQLKVILQLLLKRSFAAAKKMKKEINNFEKSLNEILKI